MKQDRNRKQPGTTGDPFSERTEVFQRKRPTDTQQPYDQDDARYAEPEHTGADEQYSVSYTQYTIVRVARLIYFAFGVVEVLVAIRFVLHLLGANSGSSFASLIYGVTAPLTAPFNGLFSNPSLGADSVLELTSLVAIIVYALVSYGLVRLLYVFAD